MKKTYTQVSAGGRAAYLEKARAYCQRLYDFAERDGVHNGHGHWAHLMAECLTRTEKAFPDLGTFGVEGDCSGNGEGHYDCLYLNAGDSYATTLLCGSSPVVEVGDWGSLIEAAEEDENDERGTITCAHCGHHAPLADGAEWRDTVCDCCGRYVDGRGKAAL